MPLILKATVNMWLINILQRVDEVVVVDATRSQDDQLLEETLNGHKVLLLNCKTLPALVEILPINVDCLSDGTLARQSMLLTN